MENMELEDLVYTYPPYHVENIQTLISGKEEFREVGALTSEAPPKKGQLFRHQKYMKRLMLQYDDQLLMHMTGTGKSCSVVSVAEHYKALAGALEDIRLTKPPYKRVYILVKGQALIDQFKYEILCKCTDGDYITDQIINSKSETARKTNVSRSISKFYTITTYGTFAKTLFKMTDEQMKNEFNNSIFIVDEVHNINDDNLGGTLKKDPLTGNEYYYKMKKNKSTGIREEKIIESRLIYDQLWRLFHLVKPRKVMLLSATPMINDAREIRSKMNLILPADRQIPDDIDWTSVAVETLEPYFRGLISYVRSLDTGAIPTYQGKLLTIEDQKSHMIVYSTQMDAKQEAVYLQAVEDPLSLRPDSDKPEAFDDLKRQAANFIFPDNSTGSVGYKKYVLENKNEFTPTKEFEKWLSSPELLRSMSAKFYEIVRLCKEDPGNCWCYSNYIRGAGAIVLGLCFAAQGFENFSETRSVFSISAEGKLSSVCGAKSLDDADIQRDRRVTIPKKLRYALLTSETTGPERTVLLELFNSYENRHGEYIKAIIGSPVTRDGLNLANSLQIHLTGPGWNQASSYQAESRAIRSTSHVDLIAEEKERLISLGLDPENASIQIKIYRHAAVTQENSSVDIEMYELSEEKDKEIKRVMRIMKEVAVDCRINYARNVRPKDVDGSAICDYDVCRYPCYSAAPEEIDYTSYDVLYTQDVIAAAKEEIIDIFRVVFQISYASLYTELSGYRRKFVDLAVTQLVEKREKIYNRYGQLSYVREDRDIIFLISDYPLKLMETSGSISLTDYSANLIGIQTMSLTEYNGSLQRGTGDILDILTDISQIDNFTLENKMLLLEKAIYVYYIQNDKNDKVVSIVNKFRNFIYIVYEPQKGIVFAQKAIDSRGKGRGRKAKEGTKFKFSDKQRTELETIIGKDRNKNVIYFHNLSTAVKGQTAHAITAKGRKYEGKIRMLKESEKLGWRAGNETEDLVYNEIIKLKNKITEPKFDIYGTVLEDGVFRIIDKTQEDAQGDTRKERRGLRCSSWRKHDIIDLMWKLKYNPFKIEVTMSQKGLTSFIVNQEIATQEQAAEYSLDKLIFYYTWYTSGSTMDKICELLENHLEDSGRLVRQN